MFGMSKTDQQFYAYYDTIEETGEVIYCGKGDNHRSDIDKSPKRNELYNDYIKNKKVIRARIPTLDEDLALKLEDWLMEHYHTWVDDSSATEHACNIDGPGTNGGSKQRSKEMGKKVGDKLRGITNVQRYGEEKAKEIFLKRSKAQKGRIKSKKECENISKGQKGIRKGKTYIEMFGEEKAKAIIEANSKPVVKLDIVTGEIIGKFASTVEASEKTGVNRGNIGSCCNGKCKQAGGYAWKFA